MADLLDAAIGGIFDRLILTRQFVHRPLILQRTPSGQDGSDVPLQQLSVLSHLVLSPWHL
jgi:hypothetical protein